MVRGKLQCRRPPTNLDFSWARAYCASSRCGRRLFGHFYSNLSFLSSFSLCQGDGTKETEILSQRALNPKHSTDQLPGACVCVRVCVCVCV